MSHTPNDSRHSGVLYVVATPIGHLGDVSARAAEVLHEADVIVAEDTRHTRKLLSHLGVVSPKLISLHAGPRCDMLALSVFALATPGIF